MARRALERSSDLVQWAGYAATRDDLKFRGFHGAH
jgi:hypothetical protein